jgi:aldehyde dehydrogenase (NAD+)
MELLLKKTQALQIGSSNSDDLGPVINETQLNGMLHAVSQAIEEGAELLFGGNRLQGGSYQNGYFMAPTILTKVSPQASISQSELFGPVTCVYRVRNLDEAIQLNNNVPFGLTSAIHTQNIHRAEVFKQASRTGVVSINGPTYGSEPHLPFGGLRQSGNGFREAGSEALDVYSDWKTVYTRHNPDLI